MSIFEPPFRDEFPSPDNPKKFTRAWWMWFVSVWRDMVLNNAYRLRSTITIDPTHSPYTMVSTIKNLLCDTNSGDIDVFLESTSNSIEHNIVNVGTSGNKVTITPFSGQTIYKGSVEYAYDQEQLGMTGEMNKGWV